MRVIQKAKTTEQQLGSVVVRRRRRKKKRIDGKVGQKGEGKRKTRELL